MTPTLQAVLKAAGDELTQTMGAPPTPSSGGKGDGWRSMGKACGQIADALDSGQDASTAIEAARPILAAIAEEMGEGGYAVDTGESYPGTEEDQGATMAPISMSVRRMHAGEFFGSYVPAQMDGIAKSTTASERRVLKTALRESMRVAKAVFENDFTGHIPVFHSPYWEEPEREIVGMKVLDTKKGSYPGAAPNAMDGLTGIAKPRVPTNEKPEGGGATQESQPRPPKVGSGTAEPFNKPPVTGDPTVIGPVGESTRAKNTLFEEGGISGVAKELRGIGETIAKTFNLHLPTSQPTETGVPAPGANPRSEYTTHGETPPEQKKKSKEEEEELARMEGAKKGKTRKSTRAPGGKLTPVSEKAPEPKDWSKMLPARG